MPCKTVVTINSTGRQSASFIRVASAVGWNVRAQIHDRLGIVAHELENLRNVVTFIGELNDKKFLDDLFNGANVAFINTTHWGDEVAIGTALADSAKKAGIKHYIYSSMPDHSIYPGQDWIALPLWAQKFTIENYVRQIGLPATFIYCGIYHNNFTSLPYPLFRMELQQDKSFIWQAPFHPDIPLPWLDVEHDVGPTVLQIFKEGPTKWAGARIPLAFSHLSPVEVCKAFCHGLSRPVHYRRGPITIDVSIPAGYKEHLEALQHTLGEKEAPYFGPELEIDCTKLATKLWGGDRDIETYAREIFPVEEYNNCLTWMEPAEMVNPDVELGFTGSC